MSDPEAEVEVILTVSSEVAKQAKGMKGPPLSFRQVLQLQICTLIGRVVEVIRIALQAHDADRMIAAVEEVMAQSD